MRKKSLLFWIASALVTLSVGFFTACEGTPGKNGANGADGETPYIGTNGNWWVGSIDLGVAAQGPKGEQGEEGQKGDKGDQGPIGSTGEDGEKGDKGDKGDKGEDGKSVNVISVQKTKTTGNVDTYTIVFSDGTKTEFTVTNGEPVTVKEVKKTKTEGLVDTYTVYFSDGTTTTFTVTNGDTPYIGENGNWWLGDKDLEVPANGVGLPEDDKKISDGLSFVATTVKGKAGMVVASYKGTDTDVVIPDYVGAVSVVGVYNDAFESNTTITSVSLSKNTVYLEANVFEDCSKLSKVEFNDCPLTEISDYAFAGTAITEIELPETVVKLGNYAFSEVPFFDFDYSNIVHFGEHSLDGLLIECVYLTDEVEYVGSYAFASTYVYTEHKERPTYWRDYIAGTVDLNETVTYGCSKNTSYIYAKEGTSVTVLRYIGNAKRIEIPSTIDNLPVRKIGYGFGSTTESGIEYLFDAGVIDDDTPSSYHVLQTLEYVKIPSSVKEIEYGAFAYSYGTMILIPESVESMWRYVGFTEDDFSASFLAFEGTTYPTLKTGWLASSESVDSTNWLNSVGAYARIAIGVNFAKLEYDSTNKAYLYKDLEGYSYFASMELESDTLTIPSTFNKAKVHTVRPDAVSSLYNLKKVMISDGVKKIQGKAFDNLSLRYVAIPDSVETINAYGFDGVCSEFYIEAAAKPDEWDSYWAGSSTSSVSIHTSVDVSTLTVSGDFMYSLSGNDVVLAKYTGTSSVILIPNKIDGKTVTTIASNFATKSSALTVYVPSTVTKIRPRAFVVTGTSTYSNFYFAAKVAEGGELPEGVDSEFFYNSYSGSNIRRYVTMDYKDYQFDSSYYVDGFYIVQNLLDGTVALYRYFGNESDVYIPRTVGGKTVTTIRSECFRYSTSRDYFIPKTVTNVESKAFLQTSYNYTYFYFEGVSTLPETYATDYYYCQPQASTTSYKTTYFNQVLHY